MGTINVAGGGGLIKGTDGYLYEAEMVADLDNCSILKAGTSVSGNGVCDDDFIYSFVSPTQIQKLDINTLAQVALSPAISQAYQLLIDAEHIYSYNFGATNVVMTKLLKSTLAIVAISATTAGLNMYEACIDDTNLYACVGNDRVYKYLKSTLAFQGASTTVAANNATFIAEGGSYIYMVGGGDGNIRALLKSNLGLVTTMPSGVATVPINPGNMFTKGEILYSVRASTTTFVVGYYDTKSLYTIGSKQYTVGNVRHTLISKGVILHLGQLSPSTVQTDGIHGISVDNLEDVFNLATPVQAVSGVLFAQQKNSKTDRFIANYTSTTSMLLVVETGKKIKRYRKVE